MLHFPNMKPVGNEKIFALNRQSYGLLLEGRGIVVKDGDTLAPGRHTLRFFFTPIVHWPEVMMAYEKSEKNFVFGGCLRQLWGAEREPV